MSKENKELLKAVMLYVDIAQETNERLAKVRTKLADIRKRENSEQLLRVKLY